jgi:2,3-diketo-5-methylthio-1-phosphopentane phosphatase
LAPRTPRLQRHGLRWVLLDIEGTTCPVSFVAGELFPYAAEQMGALLLARQGDLEVQALVAAVDTAWEQDPDPQAQALRQRDPADVLTYLQWLIREDRKMTPLKELQGLVWEQGYRSGALRGPLYGDVPPALRRWSSAGLQLAVYSSGSVTAQQLIYGYSNAGDLRPLFSGWFDTRSGPKQEAASYLNIANQLGVAAEQVLFISDAKAECQAAASTGMQVIFSCREGNPEQSPGKFEQISSFDELELSALA